MQWRRFHFTISDLNFCCTVMHKRIDLNVASSISYIQWLLAPQRLYKAGDPEARHRYTLPPDHPDFIRARQNALQISDVSKTFTLGSWLGNCHQGKQIWLGMKNFHVYVEARFSEPEQNWKSQRLWTANILLGLGWRDQEKSVDFSLENWFCFLEQEAIIKDFSPSV